MRVKGVVESGNDFRNEDGGTCECERGEDGAFYSCL